MTTVISGNWKMNGSKAMIDQWFEDFTKYAIEFENKNNLAKDKIPTILICVPDLYIEYAEKVAEKCNSKIKQLKVSIGAEDVHFEEKGAFTGNISPLFLNEINCEYTLVGHSERRQYQKEDDNTVAKKAHAALAHNITPIVCVGEDLPTREAGKHLEIVGKQVLDSTEGLDLTKIIIAYEPVWAIGTGKVPSISEIDEMEGHIKDILHKTRHVEIKDLTVVYGGSVKASNANEILHLHNVNGVLVGGASMKGEEFFGIVKASL
jgi:triosephosphate isomerase (TIM)